MKFARHDSAGYLANRLARLLAQALASEIAPLGLAPAQFTVLVELWREPGLTQRQLVERLDIEQGTMTATLARMERDGLILRRPHKDDGRARSIRLTAKAESALPKAIEAAMAVNSLALAPLSAGERRVLLTLMQRVIDGFRQPRT
jgi:DNA-binding MarR family transcriptional regulator